MRSQLFFHQGASFLVDEKNHYLWKTNVVENLDKRYFSRESDDGVRVICELNGQRSQQNYQEFRDFKMNRDESDIRRAQEGGRSLQDMRGYDSVTGFGVGSTFRDKINNEERVTRVGSVVLDRVHEFGGSREGEGSFEGKPHTVCSSLSSARSDVAFDLRMQAQLLSRDEGMIF